MRRAAVICGYRNKGCIQLPIHLKKLCVGVDSLKQLASHMDDRAAISLKAAPKAEPSYVISTRNTPKRAPEILDGGSLYWIINRMIVARNRVLSFKSTHRETGQPICYIQLSTELIPTEPHPHRPFQGWRYLENREVPLDIVGGAHFRDTGREPLPEHLLKELRALWLI